MSAPSITIDGVEYDLVELHGHAGRVEDDPASNQVEKGLAIVVRELVTEVLALRDRLATRDG